MQIELQEFVKESLKQKVSRPQIQQALKDAGWPDDEVAAALSAYAETDFSVPVPRRKPQVSAGETFRYLSAFACLTTCAIALGRLVFHLIDLWVDDPLSPSEYYSLGSVRMAVASLVVAFPLYLYLSVSTEKAVRLDPVKRTLGARKWLIYLTLFVTGGIIIGDLIALIYGFLEGAGDLRSGLKLGALLLLAGAVFGNELWKIQRTDDAAEASKGRRLVAIAAIAAVLVAIGGGLFWSGSPSKQRDLQFDADRSNDLYAISYQLQAWRQEPALGPLPEQLGELEKRGLGSDAMTDPKTGEPYGYRRISDDTAELCATFYGATNGNAAEPPRPVKPPHSPNFNVHSSGRQCFTVFAGP